MHAPGTFDRAYFKFFSVLLIIVSYQGKFWLTIYTTPTSK